MCFFFSSRRRHTRCSRDWSSDVCSSDLYLNTYYVGDRAKDRMTPEVQRWGHELYNIGHLLQGAIAYYRATGDSTLLEAGIHFVDGFLLPNFGPGPDKKPIFSGHPEIELALIEQIGRAHV